MGTKQLSGEWWASIIHAFQAHVREESSFLESYRELAEQVDDPGTRYLIDMILADEEKHHALFQGLADAALADGAASAGVPGAPAPEAADASVLLAATERYLEAEKEDAERLKALRRDLRPVRDQTLWHLLVEVMEIDTSKHIRILEYLRARLRAAAR